MEARSEPVYFAKLEFWLEMSFFLMQHGDLRKAQEIYEKTNHILEELQELEYE